jgi:hypothetical protein
MLVCVFLCTFAHETAGAAPPGAPCALWLEGKGNFWQGSGALRREIAKSYLLFEIRIP